MVNGTGIGRLNQQYVDDRSVLVKMHRGYFSDRLRLIRLSAADEL